MDPFRVPKAINRHVYKALIYLQSCESTFLSEELIAERVKRQWRRNKPKPNMDEIIHKSLSNLTDMGILACTGSSRYAVRHTIKAVGESNKNNHVEQSKPKINSTRSRVIDKKKRLGGVKPKVIKLQSFPSLNTYVLCNECIPVLGRFSKAYGDLRNKRFRSNLIPVPARVENSYNSVENPPPDMASGEALDDVEMKE